MVRPRALAVPLVPLLLCALLSAPRAGTPQPVAYSHKVHVTDNGMDCRFCHSDAARSRHAGIPAVEKCMWCHRSIAVDKPEIVKLAGYWKERKSIPWNRVTENPDHVYFPHFRMVNAGIPCLTCHPGMDRAAGAVQEQAFTMGWCMKCHRAKGASIDCWACHN